MTNWLTPNYEGYIFYSFATLLLVILFVHESTIYFHSDVLDDPIRKIARPYQLLILAIVLGVGSIILQIITTIALALGVLIGSEIFLHILLLKQEHRDS